MIRVNDPLFGKEELRLVSECIKTNWISSEGPFVKEFERKFSGYCGVRYGVACSSGTAALHLGLLALGVKAGDEVIMPAFTMIATAYAIAYTGATPVLVDSDERTWNMDISKVKGKITRRTKAILPVHIYGHPVDMDPLRRIAKKYRLKILEDAAEVHGAEYKGRKTGSLGDAAAFSFYANKIISTGEGGMVVTDSKAIAQRAAYFRNMAFQKKVRYLHKDIGFNYRMTNLQAAVGLGQLSKIGKFVQKKRLMARAYNSGLRGIAGIRLPIEEAWAKNVYWMYAILVDKKEFGISRDKLREELFKEGVDTRAFFYPMNKQPVFRKMGLFLKESYPVSERIAEGGLYLPSGLSLDEEKTDLVCEKIKKIKRKYA
ncbi:MAG: DegT/DnrJ/EryC1/StrS family aminotransferase [Candidatus Omnitrophota bacterium]|jgi:perosamine synthetase